MIVVLDTCALLWLTLEPEALSGKAHRAISSAERVLASAISIWEIGVKAKRKRLDLGATFTDYANRVAAASDIELLPIDPKLLVQTVELDWDHRDPADRIIVSLARGLDATIVTDDKAIKDFYRRTVS